MGCYGCGCNQDSMEEGGKWDCAGSGWCASCVRDGKDKED